MNLEETINGLNDIKAASLQLDNFYAQRKYEVLDSAVEKLQVADRQRKQFLDILEDIRSEIWGYDIPSPTVPEYVEHHNQMQALLKLIDAKIKEVIENE